MSNSQSDSDDRLVDDDETLLSPKQDSQEVSDEDRPTVQSKRQRTWILLTILATLVSSNSLSVSHEC